MNTEEKTFPRQLLMQPAIERFNYFKEKIIDHARLHEIDEKIMHAICYPSGASLIIVYGPTGVGKTTLREKIEAKLLQQERKAMEEDPGYMPVAGMHLIAESGSFSWKEYFIRAMAALNEPLIDRKANFETRTIYQGREVIRSSNPSAPTLRRAMESCFKHRRTKVFIIDEAQHLKNIASGRRLLNQMDTIKSLAETTNTMYVLIGTYELLDLTNLSAQLCKRSKEIHFSRYLNDDGVNSDAFASVLKTFQDHLPLAQTPDLSCFEDYLYRETFGCIGVLKNLLNEALSHALAKGAETITREMLEQCTLSTRDLVKMSQEISTGEDVLKKTDEQVNALDKFLLPVLKAKKKSKAKEQATSGTLEKKVAPKPEELASSTSSQKRNIGERDPKRDKVGVGKNAGQ